VKRGLVVLETVVRPLTRILFQLPYDGKRAVGAPAGAEWGDGVPASDPSARLRVALSVPKGDGDRGPRRAFCARWGGGGGSGGAKPPGLVIEEAL
jgi:hypothetical protein